MNNAGITVKVAGSNGWECVDKNHLYQLDQASPRTQWIYGIITAKSIHHLRG